MGSLLRRSSRLRGALVVVGATMVLMLVCMSYVTRSVPTRLPPQNTERPDPRGTAGGDVSQEAVRQRTPGRPDASNSDSNDNTALHYAASTGQVEEVRTLLSSGAKTEVVNKQGYSPLSLAALRRQLDCARVLVDAGVCVDGCAGEAWDPLTAAVLVEDPDMVRFLLSRGASPNGRKGRPTHEYSPPPLHLAASLPNDVIAHILIGAGADVNLAIGSLDLTSGTTPLFYASDKTHAFDAIIVTYLADPQKLTTTSGGVSGLIVRDLSREGHPVEEEGRGLVIRDLVAHGADVNCRDVRGSTALMRAAANGWTQVVAELLNQGADINAVSSAKHSALHYAANSGKADTVQFLLSKGAARDFADRDGKTPLELAEDRLEWSKGEKDLAKGLAEVIQMLAK